MSTEVLDNAVENSVDGTGSGGAGDAAPPDISSFAQDAGVDENIVKEWAEGDESFAKLIKGKAGDKGGEDDHASDEESDEDSAADSNSEEGKEPAAEEKNSGEAEESEEFADDVIKGLKGVEMAKLSEDAQIALANYHKDVQSKIKAAEEYDAKLNALLEDPVVKSRADAIEAGRSADLQVRGMTAQDKATIVRVLNEKGYEGDEAEDLFNAFAAGIDDVAKARAQDLANRQIVIADAQRKEAEINRQGDEIMLSLSQFNKDLAIEEKDLYKLFKSDGKGGAVPNEDHPEAEKFKNGLYKISCWAAKNGIGYDQVVKMGGKAFYAAAAAALDMPVVMNASERDKKMVANVRQKALEPFLKAKGSGTLNTSGSVGDRERAARILPHGEDIERLVTDHEYFKSRVEKCWGNAEELERLERLVEKGREQIANKK